MIGKKNIVFGFLFLALTAALGPYMVKFVFPDIQTAGSAKQAIMSEMQLLASNDFERDLEPLTADTIARGNSLAILAINSEAQARGVLNDIKGGPHAHGNLEALLNIAVGMVLCFLTVGNGLKQAISWLFIAGTLLHSGILYLAIVFQQGWAYQIMGLGIGPVLLLLALVLTGVAAAIGFNGKLAASE